jgi:outer membrane PBP1 activator LpoA protein
VRDGFLAAWFEQPAGQRFEVDLYDTGQGSLEDIHARVVAKGTDVIVGPLQRDAVAALNNLGSDIPVLALNYLPAGDPSPTLVQFGLAIEDDVATLVQWLRQEGLARVMILHGPHDWAARVERALADQGLPAVASHLLPEMRTVPDAVGRAMHIEDSRARHAEVQRLMGMPLAFTPRSRTDVDALLALVDAVEITALVPALRFHYAQRIPAFATAQTLAGAGSGTLRAMDGYRVVDLPWQVPGDPGRRKLANAFQLEGNPFASMYALGADAFRLVDRVDPANRGAFTQLMGHTGVLTLLPDGRIRRELARLQVRGGQISLAGAR